MTSGIAIIVTIIMLASSPVAASPEISETETDDSPDDCLSLVQRGLRLQPRNAKDLSESFVSLNGTEPCDGHCDGGTALSTSTSNTLATDCMILLKATSKAFENASTDSFNWPSHIFGHPKERHPAGMWAFHDEWDWYALAVCVAVLILFDIYVIRPWFEKTSKVGLARTLPVVFCWIFTAGLFNMYIGYRHGADWAVCWLNGYILEWMLSMDNIFVFHLVFKLYKTPPSLHAKALFWGVLGAILFRMLFFIALNSLLEVMHWCRYAFGLFLVFSGIQAVKADDDDDDLAGSLPVRFLNWLFNDRLLPYPHYDMEGRLWVRTSKEASQAVMRFSMLLPVIVCLELTDILFAVDSVSAKVGQIPDQFVAYSSSVFAMFGLRSLFFIMEDLVNRLRFLKYGLCFILVFIGFELIAADFVMLPATAVCVVLVFVFVFCGVLSAFFPEPNQEESSAQDTQANKELANK